MLQLIPDMKWKGRCYQSDKIEFLILSRDDQLVQNYL